MRLYIEYADSAPLSVTRDGTMNSDGTWEYVYTPPAGDGYGDYDYFRLWRTNATTRNADLVSAGGDGDYVASGVYAASNFMIENNTITLWAEGVLPVADSNIVVTMTAGKEYLDETKPITKTDVVKLRGLNFGISPLHSMVAVGDYVPLVIASDIPNTSEWNGWQVVLTVPAGMDAFDDADGDVPLDVATVGGLVLRDNQARHVFGEVPPLGFARKQIAQLPHRIPHHLGKFHDTRHGSILLDHSAPSKIVKIKHEIAYFYKVNI